MRLLLERIDDDGKQTIGRLYVLDKNDASVKDFPSLELPWKNNKNDISCIPTGKYTVVKRWSPKFKHHFHVTDVEGRSYILIHRGNYFTDIRGCILVGVSMADINGDGHIDVTNSTKAMDELLDIMPDKFTLTIVEQ